MSTRRRGPELICESRGFKTHEIVQKNLKNAPATVRDDEQHFAGYNR